jgi:hypothetical protein
MTVSVDVLVLGVLIVLEGVSTALVIRSMHQDTERTLAQIARLITREAGRTRTLVRKGRP